MAAPNEGQKTLPKSLDGLAHQAPWDDVNQRYLEPRADPNGNTYVARAKGTRTHFQATPGSVVAVLILPSDPLRKVLHAINAGLVTIFVDKTNAVTAASGTPILPNEAFDDADGTEAWWGITAAGTGDLRGWEIA